MAYSDTEVEIQLEVKRAGFLSVKRFLEKNGKFISETRQADTYYNHPSKDFLSPKYPFEWLSIRRRGKNAIVNYKHWYPENSPRNTHCAEFETDVKNPEKLERILASLGMKKLVTVKKIRRNYSFRGFTVSLDSVEGLGTFIEIEAEKSFGSPEKTLRKVWEISREIGITEYSESPRGYPYLLMERKGLFPKRRPTRGRSVATGKRNRK